MERLSDELKGNDLFHFTLAYENDLGIGDYYLRRLLCKRSPVSLDSEIQSLLFMCKSPYIKVNDGMSVKLLPHKWNDFVYGCFSIMTIEKSLKYFSTNMFFVYCRLWSFNPFYYQASYPMVDIFKYPCTISICFLC
jgi:hypothetical protein